MDRSRKARKPAGFLSLHPILPAPDAAGVDSQADGRGRENANRERIWFSPHCLKPQESLFASLAQFDADEVSV